MSDPVAFRPAGARAPAAPPPWSTMAILAFVLAFVVPPGAIVCGHIALGQIRRTGEQGRGLALAAVVIGYCFAGFVALFVLVWISAFLTIGFSWFGLLQHAVR